MKYKTLKPHRHNGVSYSKNDIRESVKDSDAAHLVKRGVLELVVEKKETKQISKKDK